MNRNEMIDIANGSDYNALMKIYNAHKINDKFDNFFAQENISAMHLNMLKSKVKDIIRKLDQSDAFTGSVADKLAEITTRTLNLSKPGASRKNIIERVKIDSNPHVDRKDLPEDLQEIYDENIKITNDMKTLHEKMKHVKVDEERKMIVGDLCNLEEKRDANWKKIDTWYQNFKAGKIQEPVDENDPVVIAKKIAAAKKYIDRYYNSEKEVAKIRLKEYYEFFKKLKIEYTPAPLREKKKKTVKKPKKSVKKSKK